MKFKVHLGGQSYNLHHGSQIYNVVGPSFYNFASTTLELDPTRPWIFSLDTYTASDQQVDGWSEVEISNTWTQVLDKSAISIDAEADTYYTTWGFIFGDSPEYSPNIPNSSNFIDHITNNFFTWYPGFYCNLTDSTGTIFELSQIMTPSGLLDYDPAFYAWLQNSMGTSQGLLDIGMFEGILTFTYVQSPNTAIRPSTNGFQSVNLYFGWLPRRSVNNDSTYSYLVYLGYELSSRGNHDVYSANQDAFFYAPEDVCLNLIYHEGLS